MYNNICRLFIIFDNQFKISYYKRGHNLFNNLNIASGNWRERSYVCLYERRYSYFPESLHCQPRLYRTRFICVKFPFSIFNAVPIVALSFIDNFQKLGYSTVHRILDNRYTVHFGMTIYRYTDKTKYRYTGILSISIFSTVYCRVLPV